MASLKIEVEVTSDDENENFLFLLQLQKAIIAITDLHPWGFTDDEYICKTLLDSAVPVGPED